MQIKRDELIFKSIYYTITAAIFVVLVFALRYAYKAIPIHVAWWIILYLLCAVALFYAVKYVVSRKRGIHIFLAHTTLLQLLPLGLAIAIFCTVPRLSSHFVANVDVVDNFKPIDGKVSTYERAFNDMQSVQKSAAEANGLPPFESRAVIESQYNQLRRDDKLVKIETNSKYVVRPLSHSAPYVVPKVERLLNDIADRFQQKTQSKVQFMVTSVLRTEEDLKKLQRVNGNASTTSCHCNATTVDISYVRFEQDPLRPRDVYQLRLALAKSIHELRNEGRCYVKREKKQYCYHITVR